MALEEDTETVSLFPFIDCYNTVVDKRLDFPSRKHTFCKWEARSTLPGRMSAARWDFYKDGLASLRRVQLRANVHLMGLLWVSTFNDVLMLKDIPEQMGE
jgi:hypothetical protein